MGKLLSADLNGMADEAERVASRCVEQMGLEAKTRFNAAARKASGGDSVLSGVGKRGKKVSARYDFKKGSRGLTLTVKAIGPWQFIEAGHRGGYQVPRRPKRKGKLRRLETPQGWRTAPFTVDRPARARHAWSEAATALEDDIDAVFTRAFLKLVS